MSDVVDRMRDIIDAQAFGPPDDDGEIVGPFQKTWVLALLDVVEAARDESLWEVVTASDGIASIQKSRLGVALDRLERSHG